MKPLGWDRNLASLPTVAGRRTCAGIGNSLPLSGRSTRSPELGARTSCRGAQIYAQTPGTEMPQERHQRRVASGANAVDSRARYGLRRLLGVLSILLVLLVGILFLSALIGQRPVARLHVPTAEAVPKPPVTEPPADSRASSQTGSEASTPPYLSRPSSRRRRRTRCGTSSSG